LLVASQATAADNTWVVNSSGDGGGPCAQSSCTLRAAILAANASSGSDRITFAIEPPGQQTITVGAGEDHELPAITGSDVVIDATTQSGGGEHGIRLNDPDTSGGESGFVLAGQRITIRGFVITRFDRYGIYLVASSRGDVVAGNWIGTRDGASDDGVGDDGIHVKGGGGHRIGGTSPAGRNVVSGGGNDGIELEDSSDNVIVGNYVAMAADGLVRLPNTGSGIEINGLSFRNRVGGLTARERNIASGSDGIGVQILGSMQPDGTCQAPQRNVVQGNYLGLNVKGRKPGSYGNRGAGMELGVCARHNTIGGTAPGARNIASGNHDDGIQLDGAGGPGGTGAVCENTIQGNYVGLDPSGQAARANVDDGIDLGRGSCNNLVGGTLAAAANVVAGNLNDGIDLHEGNAAGAGTNGNVIRGNVVGLAADRKATVKNLRNGIHIRFLSQRNVVRGNVIAGSGEAGVAIEHPSARSNIVRGNKIGTASDGVTVRGNALYGVWLYNGARLNVVRNNLITGSGRDAVAVEQIVGSLTTTKQNKITRNRILRNGGVGIDLLPVDGVNGNDGATSSQVGNVGLDFPVIARATSSSVAGTAPPNSIVEVFTVRAGAGETNGEGAKYVGKALADGGGAWCLGGLSLSGSLTATTTDDAGNTSEFGANVSVAGRKNLCTASSGLLFFDEFTAPNGSRPVNWEVRRSAAGAGAGATIQSNELREDVVLTSDQAGGWHYVQAREKVVEAMWASGAKSFRWRMTTSAAAGQSASFVLTPGAASGNAVSQADYLRLRVENGRVALIRRVGGGPATAIWAGSVAVSSGLRDFELRVDARNLSLYEGPVGTAVLRAGPLAHGLAFTSGYPYLHASTNSLTPFAATFDSFRIASSSSGGPGVSASAPCVGAQPGPYRRVVWIVMEDKDYTQVIGSSNAPYINDLARKCGLATQFYAETGGSLANYIAMTSGSTQGIRDAGDPSSHPLSVPSIFSQLPDAWLALQESMPSNCYLSNQGLYVARHNPAAYYTNIRAECLRRDVPLRDPPDLSARFTFITPNLCSGMHDCPTAQDAPTQVRNGSAWLSVWLPKILNSAAYTSGSMAVFLTWDEDGGSGARHIPTLVIAPSVRPGTRSSSVFNHYALLRTTEEMLGLTTFLGNAKSAPSMRAAFHL
jgi:CSLREA domain-containing protein